MTYVVEAPGAEGPLDVSVQLRYQPVSYRWAENLRRYDAPEPTRCVAFFDAMAPASSAVLAQASARID